MDEEQKLDASAERLSASAFLARYECFRYIETRSEMKMSDKKSPFVSVSLTAFFAKGTCDRTQHSRRSKGFLIENSNY